MEALRIADLLVSHGVRTHGDEVSIIACYGSRATGQASPRSDLDIFYIPVDGRNPPLARPFIVAGVPVDLWPISWEMAEQLATGRARGWAVAPSLIAGAHVLYARSEQDQARFEGLKQLIVDLQKPESREHMLRRALDAFPSVLSHLGNLRLAVTDGDFPSLRWAGWSVVMASVECLALVNQTYFTRGWAYVLDEIPRLATRPEDLAECIITIATDADPARVAGAAEGLVAETRGLLRREQDAYPPEVTVRSILEGIYPEFREHVNKVLSQCEQQQAVAASFEAWFIQSDLSQMLASTRSGVGYRDMNLHAEYAATYRELGFPDLMEHTTADGLAALAEQARLLDARMRQVLAEHSLSLHTFETIEELERALDASL